LISDFSNSNDLPNIEAEDCFEIESWRILSKIGSDKRTVILLGGFSEDPKEVLLRYSGIIKNAHVIGLYWPGFGKTKCQGGQFDHTKLLPLIQTICDRYPHFEIDLLAHSFGARAYLSILDQIDSRIVTIHLVSPVLKLGWWEDFVAYLPKGFQRFTIQLVLSPFLQRILSSRFVGSKESRFVDRFKELDHVESLMLYYLKGLKNMVARYSKVRSLLAQTKCQIRFYLFQDDRISNASRWISEIKTSSRVELIQLKGRHFSRIQ